MNDFIERIETALGAMQSSGPRNLRAYLKKPGPDFEDASESEIESMLDLVLSPDPNSEVRLRFSGLLRSWDNIPEAKWTGGVARNTEGRRKLINEFLQSGDQLARRIDALIPFFPMDEPVIIAEKHIPWYLPQLGVRDYYWSTYLRYLREKRLWDVRALINFDNSTRAIVDCLANPVSRDSYPSRGLVMGYVQSGKTANFMGVSARAADAGYRLIIVLAGTWNILRNQTQRRFDKELLGKQFLHNDDNYRPNAPRDWEEFLDHGFEPEERGHYGWQRLTRPDYDFRRLKAAIDSLEFEKAERAAPLNDPRNLYRLQAKLLVVKKHSGVLANLVRDLNMLKTRLAELPTLVIDDESDQAGLNTVDPRKQKPEKDKERSKTNLGIVELLKLFPRGQYIGYTATPYANVLVDPKDSRDLFPNDFIVSLDRPTGYMGISDFFDPSADYTDLDKHDFSEPEIAFIRRVENALGADDEDLIAALTSYVLAGAIKLFRHDRDPRRYRMEQFRHHTMLVHTSQRKGDQTSLSDRLKDLWDRCAFKSPGALKRLEDLWTNDFAKVCRAQDKDIVPKSFSELVPFLADAIKRIETGPRIFIVVNSDSPEAPDFSSAPIWKVLVGGNKLSRGYTVEGLTISFYRRVAGTADTLMQMGRWFGFRAGYQDLVRVFLGVREGRKSDVDLVSHFKDVCRMEERFRDELKRYIRKPGVEPVTPKQIPPLIAMTGSLPPAAKNKMYNAVLAQKNFGGQRSMPTLMSAKPSTMKNNLDTLQRLVSASKSIGTKLLGGISSEGKRLDSNTVVLTSTNIAVATFLKSYIWLETEFRSGERPQETDLQIEFLEKMKHGIRSWLILAPQRQVSFGETLKLTGIGELTVKERQRSERGGFRVFGEPAHRTVGEFIAQIEEGKSKLAQPNPDTLSLRDKHSGILLLYPVRETENAGVSVGFELIFPENEIPFEIGFTVRR